MELAWNQPAVEPEITITAECAGDVAAREALLARAMGPKWKKKASQKLRRGRRPSEGLSFVAQRCRWQARRHSPALGCFTGREWTGGAASRSARRRSVAQGRGRRLGPDAVAPSPRQPVSATGSILLVGDAPYYAALRLLGREDGQAGDARSLRAGPLSGA